MKAFLRLSGKRAIKAIPGNYFALENLCFEYFSRGKIPVAAETMGLHLVKAAFFRPRPFAVFVAGASFCFCHIRDMTPNKFQQLLETLWGSIRI